MRSHKIRYSDPDGTWSMPDDQQTNDGSSQTYCNLNSWNNLNGIVQGTSSKPDRNGSGPELCRTGDELLKMTMWCKYTMGIAGSRIPYDHKRNGLWLNERMCDLGNTPDCWRRWPWNNVNSDTRLLGIRTKPGYLRKLAVTHGIGQGPRNARTWMGTAAWERDRTLNRTDVRTRCSRAVGMTMAATRQVRCTATDGCASVVTSARMYERWRLRAA